MTTISQTLTDCTLGDPATAENLSVLPLFGRGKSALDYLTLAEALAERLARVSEVSSAGVVPQLRFENLAAKPILILDGEELVGAKQNRTVNVTILAPAGKTLVIPVTCVEAGRWASRSTHFDAAGRAHFARGRAEKMASVSASLAEGASRQADQSAVWDAIAAKSARMHVRSATSALGDVFETHRARVEDYVGKLEAQPGQTGAVFAIDGRVEGLELFDSAGTFAKLLPVLVRSYAVDALETVGARRQEARREDAEAFVNDLAKAATYRYPAVGLGEEIRLTAHGVIAGALVVDETVVHLAAFTREPSEVRERGPRMSSARRRAEIYGEA